MLDPLLNLSGNKKFSNISYILFGFSLILIRYGTRAIKTGILNHEAVIAVVPLLFNIPGVAYIVLGVWGLRSHFIEQKKEEKKVQSEAKEMEDIELIPEQAPSQYTNTIEICKQYVGEHKFQYLLYVKDEKPVFVIHVLNRSLELRKNLEIQFLENPNTRLATYMEYGLEFIKKTLAFDQELDKIESRIGQGEIIRLVFDVERGGVFFGQIEDNAHSIKEYIFAATIYQEEMDKCSILIGDLVDKIRNSKGLNPIIQGPSGKTK